MFSNKSFDEFSKIVKESLQKRAASLVESEEFQSSILIKEFEDADDQKKPALTRQELLRLLGTATYYNEIMDRVVSDEDIHSDIEDRDFAEMYSAEFAEEDDEEEMVPHENTFPEYEDHVFDGDISEKELTPAELKKREEVAKAIEKKNPDMPMDKKMAVATSVAKKVAESEETNMKHRVGVTVSDPHHTSVSQRKETMYKTVKLSAESKEHAVEKAKQFYKKKGYKVHEANHIGSVNEEVDQLDELSKETLKSYHDKSYSDFKKKTGETNVSKETSTKYKRDTNNRMSGMDKAETRLRKEETEQINELSKTTLGSYVKKAGLDATSQGIHAGAMAQRGEKGDGEKFNKSYDKAAKRLRGIDKAVDRLTKEDEQTDESCMTTATRKTFKQFKEEAKKDPCWDGYEQIGMKEKGGKQVPNCVPKDKK